jgi:hypothetical protein
MTIRTHKRKKSPQTYDALRLAGWRDQNGSQPWDYRKSTQYNGEPLKRCVLQPAPNEHMQDIWHCPNPAAARQVAKMILNSEQVTDLTFKGTWVYVSWSSPKSRELPDRPKNKRTRVTG